MSLPISCSLSSCLYPVLPLLLAICIVLHFSFLFLSLPLPCFFSLFSHSFLPVSFHLFLWHSISLYLLLFFSTSCSLLLVYIAFFLSVSVLLSSLNLYLSLWLFANIFLPFSFLSISFCLSLLFFVYISLPLFPLSASLSFLSIALCIFFLCLYVSSADLHSSSSLCCLSVQLLSTYSQNGCEHLGNIGLWIVSLNCFFFSGGKLLYNFHVQYKCCTRLKLLSSFNQYKFKLYIHWLTLLVQ